MRMLEAIFCILFAMVTPSHAQVVVPIKWVKTTVPAMPEVRDGVCWLYMPDTSSRLRDDLVAAEPLVERCIAHGGLTGKGDFDLVWWHVSREEVWKRYDQAYPSPALTMKNIKMHGGTNGIPDGFYQRNGGACVVVTHGMGRLGHELKHCYEGDWHL